jgi:phosphoglycolate phosphatase-like HAD superfamily hydrolase
MTDSEQLVDTVAEALRRAGLARRDDAWEAGGYGVQPAFPLSPPEVGAYVVWHSAGELASEAFEHLEASDLEHASVLHMGRVLEAMAEAMLEILRSAGFEARMSNDDLAPGVVEVLRGGRPPGPV